jgi:hypothetical protein
MHRRSLVWLITVPLAVLGSEAAHQVASALLGAPGGPRSELFSSAGPGAGLVRVGVTLALVIVGLALAGRVLGAWSSPRGGVVPALPFAALAPLVFVVQEQVEALLHGGSAVAAMLDARFLPGLLLQLPFAGVGYVVARLLLRLADEVCARLQRRRPAPRPRRSVSRPRPRDTALRRLTPACTYAGRAPPALLPAG